MSTSAPPDGTSLGPLRDIDDGDVREFRFGEDRRAFSMLVIRKGNDAFAYVNECPHQFLPLNYRAHPVITADGERIVCGNHYAEFSVRDGCAKAGVVDPDACLTRIPVRIDMRRQVVIGTSRQ
ncbi:MAG TPA: Rieske 2Fe-2S domain-containing protein [Casimicrobiaceae bacterium]|nr:Rieske 2Fe-2S domain-containing protein [Casimicrobiaceae bacterium]